MKAFPTTLIAATALLAAALPVLAHHGTNISYDRAKQFSRQAVVTRFEYRNPHPQLYVDLKDDKGTSESWSLELLPNPAQLIRNGWSRVRSQEAFKPGTVITVEIAPSKAGGTVGLLLRAASLKGEELVTGGGGAGGRQADPDAGRAGGAGRGGAN
jgi:hypothetical protein